MKHGKKKILESFLAAAPEARIDARWRPAADVLHTSSGWLIKLELAGVDPGEVDVSVAGSRVVVRGARRDCDVTSESRVHSMEISYSRFKRTIQLPHEVENADVRVESRHGMVLIWILTGTKG